jgi:tungstate transport system ATP-binding protein
MIGPSLVVENLSLNLSGHDIFQIDRLALQKGEVLALVGPNGAGKSSLLLTLALLQSPTAGSISFNGVIAGNGNVLSLRRRMAIVFQDALLLDTTVLRNLIIPLRIRGVSKDEAAERAEKWLGRLSIDHLAERKARHLSGGEAQRASLARAFALEPEFLFLDEPLGALDYPTRKALLGELRQILKDMAMTTLFVTHDFTEIPYLASMVGVLYEGHIVKYGTIREVFGEELLESKAWTPWESG